MEKNYPFNKKQRLCRSKVVNYDELYNTNPYRKNADQYNRWQILEKRKLQENVIKKMYYTNIRFKKLHMKFGLKLINCESQKDIYFPLVNIINLCHQN